MASVLLLLPVLLVTLPVVPAVTDYCNIPSCDTPSEHTLCLYSSSGAASGCGTVVERGVSAADQDDIVDAHNNIRHAVKSGLYVDNKLPAAQTMPSLTWDAELATVAQRWADQCSGGHDSCRDVTSFAVGQNFASRSTSSSANDWTSEAVEQWFDDELPLFTQTDLTYQSGTGTGHLTQVIWADTTKIGCGFIAVEDSITVSGSTFDLIKRNYFCNYGPAGNYIGEEIYVPA